MDRYILSQLNQARAQRKPMALITNTITAEQHLIDLEQYETYGQFKHMLELYVPQGQSRIVKDKETEFFLALYLPKPRLVMIGAVHISQHLIPLAHAVGFETIIIDPREAFASKERFPHAQFVADWPEDAFIDKPLDRYSALAALTHDPKIDDGALIEALRKHCFYVGALGSRKTHNKRVDRLIGSGVSQEDIKKIHAPIGLNIGASGPAEIALSVMGEIIQVYRSGISTKKINV